MLESVRAAATGVYNPSLANTPFLLELSKKSLVVEEMYSVIPRTSAAWVSVLQGVYPGTNSSLMYWAYQEANKPTFASLPRLLRNNGYKSAFFVPTHLNYENEGQLIANMGFDLVVSGKDYGESHYEQVNSFGFEDMIMTKPILSWVDAQQRHKNAFLLAIMTNVGHEKYAFPSSWKSKAYEKNDNEDYQNYLNCIAYIDNFLKQLFDNFEARGLFKDTIFLILGDHGDSFGEHGTRERALSLYEESLHIPMIIFGPSIFPNGSIIKGIRQQIDILPTIADVLDYTLKVKGTLPGISLLKQSPNDRELLFGSILEEIAIAMRKGSHKYVYKFDSSPLEIYDLENDRLETKDIATEINESEAQSAKNKMLEWYYSVESSLTSSKTESSKEQPQ